MPLCAALVGEQVEATDEAKHVDGQPDPILGAQVGRFGHVSVFGEHVVACRVGHVGSDAVTDARGVAQAHGVQSGLIERQCIGVHSLQNGRGIV